MWLYNCWFHCFPSKVVLTVTELNEMSILTEFQVVKTLNVPQRNLKSRNVQLCNAMILT